MTKIAFKSIQMALIILKYGHPEKTFGNTGWYNNNNETSHCVSLLHLCRPSSPSLHRRLHLCANTHLCYTWTRPSCILKPGQHQNDWLFKRLSVIYKCDKERNWLLLQHISSLRSPQSSTPSHVRLLNTHLELAQMKSQPVTEISQSTALTQKWLFPEMLEK